MRRSTRHLRRLAVVLIAGAALILAAGCSSDDDSDATQLSDAQLDEVRDVIDSAPSTEIHECLGCEAWVAQAAEFEPETGGIEDVTVFSAGKGRVVIRGLRADDDPTHGTLTVAGIDYETDPA